MQLTKEHFLKIYGDYLEPNTDINQKNVVFKCPFHSDSNPSYAVSTDPTHPVGHCFSCSEKNSWIGFYQKTRNVDYKTALKELDLFEENHVTQPKYVHLHPEQLIPKEKKQHIEVDYTEYCYNAWNNTIMDEKKYEFYGKKLYELRGITYDTAVACMVGYDPEKGWILPLTRFKDKKIVGYEVRQKEFKNFPNGNKCFKAKNTPSCLCVVWQGFDNKKAICCEGAIDSMFMYQYLHERNQRQNKSILGQVQETILTPSNGVKTVLEIVKEAELWNKFEEVLFVLDEDAPSRAVTKELEKLSNEHNGKFKFFKGMPDGFDFEDYYKQGLKKELYG